MKPITFRARVVVLLLVLMAAPGVLALTDEEVFRNFRFNLINPGARSLALGGAFISLADDATAAQANPAGLAFLRKWEAFAELRSIDNAAKSSSRSETLPTATKICCGRSTTRRPSLWARSPASWGIATIVLNSPTTS